VPNLLVLRPGDGNEITGAYKVAFGHRKGHVMLIDFVLGEEFDESMKFKFYV